MTVDCPECGDEIVFGVMSIEEYEQAFKLIKETKVLTAAQAREEADKANVVPRHIMGAIAIRVQIGEYEVRVSSADVSQAAADKLKELSYGVKYEGRVVFITW